MTLIALLQARNEARFLPGWLESIAPCVDGIVALDDGSTDATPDLLRAHPKTIELLRNPPGQKWDERGNQMALIMAGRRHGATWFMCLDADHRLERGFSDAVHELLRRADTDGTQVFSFKLRELWGDRHHYRVDGAWGDRERHKIFRNNPEHRRFDPRTLHRYWMPLELVSQLAFSSRDTGFNLYHLRMIAKADREARFARYKEIDPEARFEPEGYDYLVDETGLAREAVPEERGFLPARDPAIAGED